MRDHSSSLAPVIMMLLLTALTFWLSQVIQGEKPRGPQRHDPDYWVERFEVRRFDVEGKLQHTMLADKLLHYADDDTTVVTSPHITYHQGAPSEIFARTAHIGRDGKVVDLIDDVQVIRYGANENSPPTVLETRTLRVFPDDEKARTKDPVLITQGLSIIKGVGLEIDNKSGMTVLHGRVTGFFHRNAIETP